MGLIRTQHTGGLLLPSYYVKGGLFPSQNIYGAGFWSDFGASLKRGFAKVGKFAKKIAPTVGKLALKAAPYALDYGTEALNKELANKDSKIFGKTDQGRENLGLLLNGASSLAKKALTKAQKKQAAADANVKMSSDEASKIINGNGVRRRMRRKMMARGRGLQKL